MKAHKYYTITQAVKSGQRQNVIMLAALAILLAGSIALLALNQRASIPGTPSATHTRQVCRPCEDERLAAMSGAYGAPPQSLDVSGMVPNVRQTIRNRVFRDEVLGADQLNLAFLRAPANGIAVEASQPILRTSGPR